MGGRVNNRKRCVCDRFGLWDAEGMVGRLTPRCWLPDYKPVSVPFGGGSHSSRPRIAGRLKRPTRESDGAGRSSSPIWSCSAWGLPCQRDCSRRGALLPHHFTLTLNEQGGIFSVALSVSVSGPRPLAGTPPYGDRTFLPRILAEPGGDCPSGSPHHIVALRRNTIYGSC